MRRKDQHKIEAEKQELTKPETAKHGKPLTSVSTTGGTSRQQALAAKKRDGKQVATVEGVDAGGRGSAPPKRSNEPIGKGVALPQVEDHEDITEEDQVFLKKAKVSKGKKVDTKKDRAKKPTESELYGHLKNGVLWPPTRFADIKIMEELEIGDDIKQMLERMNMQNFFTMAYPTYEEESCQFLASLEATFHTAKHVRQGWGNIKFKLWLDVTTVVLLELGRYIATELLLELGRYVATELWLEPGRYVVTGRALGRYVATERALGRYVVTERALGRYVATEWNGHSVAM
ncbi:hypothetical protein F2Q70_00021275 [Brassica cretica]|uniref:Arabidopsis retrotransposon Orf1 C-terminal domain-containing protein n=1 Tax=Brassica cretica TaxID=69181 RepID=A0A8S9GWX3_BRACR|nr:hypothetical protein F2Q70_00021275 [Brassica cretica]